MSTETNFDAGKVERQLKQYFTAQIDGIRHKMLRIGEGFVNDGRTMGDYQDQTGNLRSSVGYSLGMGGNAPETVKQGDLVRQGRQGLRQGKQAGEQLIKAEDRDALVLVGYAGMEYGIDVEARGRDVITGATKRAMRKMKAIMKGK